MSTPIAYSKDLMIFLGKNKDIQSPPSPTFEELNFNSVRKCLKGKTNEGELPEKRRVNLKEG